MYKKMYIHAHTYTHLLEFLLRLHFKKINLFIYLFIFGCIGSLLPCAGFLQLWRVGATLCCGVWASHCSGSLVVEHELQACGLSSCGLRPLERKLSSCGAQAQLLQGVWDLPGPGLKLVSPALAGGFLTTVPPGKSEIAFLKYTQTHTHTLERIDTFSVLIIPTHKHGTQLYFYTFFKTSLSNNLYFSLWKTCIFTRKEEHFLTVKW